jgi:two-component system catabolic regulation response regulator CreB/two-component system response regulator ChvI
MSQRILVVDDEKDIATILKQGLESSGFQVDAFTDPEQALSHFKADYYDVVLLDVKMPKMNGFELCRELVKIDSKPKMCFMTAFEVNLSEAKLMFPTLKADAFMKKPIAISKILNIIQTALNNTT